MAFYKFAELIVGVPGLDFSVVLPKLYARRH
jgi:hypothetical protein